MDRQFHLRVFFWPFLCLFSSFKHNQLKYVEPNSSQKFLGIFGFQKTSKLSFDRAESQNFHFRTFLYILMQNLKCYLSIGTNLQKNCLKVLPQTYDLFVYCFLPPPLIGLGCIQIVCLQLNPIGGSQGNFEVHSP